MHPLSAIHEKKGFFCDMDGVIYHGNRLLPGVKEFVQWLKDEKKHYLFLTNSSERSPKELAQKLARLGLEVGEEHFYTSALATARFLDSQKPGCTAFVIGAPGLVTALYDVGISMNDVNPDYVVVGETTSYNFDMVNRAVQYVRNGAKLIGTNPDVTGPAEDSVMPACRSLTSPIEMASGKKAYFIGKPNVLMMRTGLKMLDVHTKDAVIIGDNMETDILSGVESGMDTVLVLSGCSSVEDISRYAYCPKYVLNGVKDIIAVQK